MRLSPCSRLTLTLVRALAAAIFGLPLLWALLAALRPAGTPLAAPLLAVRPTLDAFGRLFAVLPVWRFTANSLLVAAIAVPLTLLTARGPASPWPGCRGRRNAAGWSSR